MSDELKVLGQTKKDSYDGDFVFGLKGQTGVGTAKEQGFGHVHKDWYKNGTMSYEDGLQALAVDQSKIVDHLEPLSNWLPTVKDGRFGLEHKTDGQVYFPTEHAIKNIATVGLTSEWFLRDLVTNKKHPTKKDKKTGEPSLLFNRDAQDAELLARVVSDTLFRSDRIDQSKKRLFRTWSDGTLRALLSDQYAIVNNQWVLEVMKELIPGGRLSHWRGDADSIFGNVLIPDTIRQEQDSDYGGMLSLSNSEIGIRVIGTLPNVFRSICLNGCIWNRENGVAMHKRHRGQIDLDDLKKAIRENLNKQIPLLTEGVDKLLDLRTLAVGDVPMRNVFAQLAKDFSLSKKQANGVFDAWHVEAQLLGPKSDESRSAFSVANAVTRFGQTLDNSDWVRFDEIGGDITNFDAAKWGKFTFRAKELDEKNIESAFLAV